MSDNRKQENFEFLAADDPLYAGIQQKLKQQLLRQEQKLELEYQEAKVKRKNIERDKEQVGVRLYTAQQQLASNQMDYEKSHDNYNIAQRLRIESQQKLAQVNEIYMAKKQETNVLKNKVTKAQKQLETLMRHYHQIETYNVQLKSDISVTKKETFTAEENVSNLEKVKKKQDMLIDSMNEESKRLEEQKNILTAQIISQKEQTEQAKKILKEAEEQMEKVTASKKKLLEKWQKSIMDMQKRDSAVQTARERLNEEKQANALMLNELAGIKNEIRKQEQLTESLGAQSVFITKMKNNLQIKKNQLISEEEKVSAQLLSLKQSLGNTQNNIRVTSLEQKSVEDSMYLVQTNIMKLHTETKRLFEKLVDQKSEHTTIEKTAANMLKQARKIGGDIEEKQMQLQNILNEIARIKIDQLNTKSQIELLEKKKEQALAQQNEKKYLVITYEVQIKQGHDINEKKQHEVGRLNKLHDELMSKANDEGKNPEENKLINMVRETEDLEKTCNQMYREWIKKQTILVNENNKLQQLKEKTSNLENKRIIMEQKKLRLNANYEGYNKEINEIRINLKGLQQQMNKLNDNIAANNDKKQKIENENVNLESEFIEKLKEMERQAVKLEINIDRIRQEKADLMNEIVECQRQILLWERKYQLQKEMQQTIDPSIGQSEIQELRKQIHRMELKLSSLEKQQSKILTEANRAIDKKDFIEVKITASKQKEQSKKKQPQTTHQLKSVMKVTKQNEKNIMKSLADIQKSLSKREGDLENVNQTIQRAGQDVQNLQIDIHNLQTERVLAKIKKNIDILKITSVQKKYKKLDDFCNKTTKLMYSEGILREKLNEIKDRNIQLYDSIQKIGEKYGQYAEILTPLLETSSVNSNVM